MYDHLTSWCKSDLPPPAFPLSLHDPSFGKTSTALPPFLPPSLRGSVWTLCSLCCVLQADARPPRSTCHGRRSLWLTTGCPSPRPRSGTHPAEVRTERLPRFTSKNPSLQTLVWFLVVQLCFLINYFWFAHFWWTACLCLCLVIDGHSHTIPYPTTPSFLCCIMGNLFFRALLISAHIVAS